MAADPRLPRRSQGILPLTTAFPVGWWQTRAQVARFCSAGAAAPFVAFFASMFARQEKLYGAGGGGERQHAAPQRK